MTTTPTMRNPPPRSRREKPIAKAAESDFWPELIKIAVSQICRSMGFESAESPALEALTDIATRHLKLTAKLAAESANRNSRTESNLGDVAAALEDLASGFTGGPSGVFRELMVFVEYGCEIPFAQPMPRVFLEADNVGKKKKKRLIGRSTNNGVDRCDHIRRSYREEGRLRHVPRWLPDIPEVVEEEFVETRKREFMRWEENHGDNRERSGDLDRSTRIGGDVSSGSNQIEVSEVKRRKVRFNLGRKAALRGSVRNLSCSGEKGCPQWRYSEALS